VPSQPIDRIILYGRTPWSRSPKSFTIEWHILKPMTQLPLLRLYITLCLSYCQFFLSPLVPTYCQSTEHQRHLQQFNDPSNGLWHNIRLTFDHKCEKKNRESLRHESLRNPSHLQAKMANAKQPGKFRAKKVELVPDERPTFTNLDPANCTNCDQETTCDPCARCHKCSREKKYLLKLWAADACYH